jgi:hypothetical protein
MTSKLKINGILRRKDYAVIKKLYFYLQLYIFTQNIHNAVVRKL